MRRSEESSLQPSLASAEQGGQATKCTSTLTDEVIAVYLCMDSPHGNQSLQQTYTEMLHFTVGKRKSRADSGYCLWFQAPFKGDAMTVAEIPCCVEMHLGMYSVNLNSKLSQIFETKFTSDVTLLSFVFFAICCFIFHEYVKCYQSIFW